MDHRQKKRYMKRWVLAMGCLSLAGCQPKDLGDVTAAARMEERVEIQQERATGLAEKSLELPVVDGDRLWTHLESLVGQRYWAKERAAARQTITAALVASGWEVEEQAFERGRNLVATYPLRLNGNAEEAVSERAVSEQAVSERAVSEAGQIIVGAHYDTVQGSPGADDNATGVAVLLELAALYDELHHVEQQQLRSESAVAQASSTLPQGLTLVFFDQEEQGLLGSFAFTAEPGNLEDVRSVVVLDMLGASCEEPGCQQYPEFLDQMVEGLSDRGDFIAVVGEAERPGLLGAFGRAEGDAALPSVLRVPVPFKGLLTPDVLRSDHAPFWLNGVGAVLVTDTANLRNPHYHQPSDDLSQVDRGFFQGVAQQVVNGVWRLLAQPLKPNPGQNLAQPHGASF